MADVVCEEYASSLNDLTFNSKPHISMLTQLAEENIQYAPHIVRLIEAHLQKVSPEIKLPAIYLIDSIVKNLRGEYLSLFTQNLVSSFCSVFEKVDEKTRLLLFKLRQTWVDVFPYKKLYAIDVRVRQMDPAWPVSAQASIHVNPKFLKTATEDDAATKDNQEIQEAEMRKQLIAKQQELLRLQQQKLELEFLQTKAKLEEQKRLLQTQQTDGEDKPQDPPKIAEMSTSRGAIVPPVMANSSQSLMFTRDPRQIKDPRMLRDNKPGFRIPNLSSAVTKPVNNFFGNKAVDAQIKSEIKQNTGVVKQMQDKSETAIAKQPVLKNNSARSELQIKGQKKKEMLMGIPKCFSKKKIIERDSKKMKNELVETKKDQRKKTDSLSPKKSPELKKDFIKDSPEKRKIDKKPKSKLDVRDVEGGKKRKIIDKKSNRFVGSNKKEHIKKGDQMNRRTNFRSRRNYRSNRDRSESPELKPEQINASPKTQSEESLDAKKLSDKEGSDNRGRSRSPIAIRKEPRVKKKGILNDLDKFKSSPEGNSDDLGKENKMATDIMTDVDLRHSSNSPTRNRPKGKRDAKEDAEEPPNKRRRNADDEDAANLPNLFGSKDQDYRQIPQNEKSHLQNDRNTWAQYKADHPDEFKKSPHPFIRGNRVQDFPPSFRSYDMDLRMAREFDNGSSQFDPSSSDNKFPGKFGAMGPSNAPPGRNSRLRPNDPRMSRRGFGRPMRQTNRMFQDSRNQHRNPTYDRYYAEFENSQPSMNIPNALLLDRQADIMRQADQQLKSGHLTREQHHELLNQLAKLYELQLTRQKQREEQFNERIMSEHVFEGPDEFENKFEGSVEFENKNATPECNRFNVSPSFPESEQISNEEKPPEPETTGRTKVSMLSIFQREIPTTVVDEDGTSMPADDGDRFISIDGKVMKLKYVGCIAVILDGNKAQEILFRGTRREIFVDGEIVLLGFEGDEQTFYVKEKMHKMKFGTPTHEIYIDDVPYEARFGGSAIKVKLDDEIHEIRLGGPPPDVELKELCGLIKTKVEALTKEIGDEKSENKTKAVKDDASDQTQSKVAADDVTTREAVDDSKKEFVSKEIVAEEDSESVNARQGMAAPRFSSYGTQDEFGRKDFDDYQSRDYREKGRDKWTDQWREKSFRNERLQHRDYNITNQNDNQYWGARRDDDFNRRKYGRDRGGRHSSPQRGVAGDYNRYRETMRPDFPPYFQGGGNRMEGPRMRFDIGMRPPYDNRSRYESRPRFDMRARNDPRQPMMRGSGPAHYFPNVIRSDMHRSGFPPNQFALPDSSYGLPADKADPSVSTGLPSAVSFSGHPQPVAIAPSLNVSELFQKLVAAGIVPANNDLAADSVAASGGEGGSLHSEDSQGAANQEQAFDQEDYYEKVPTIEFTSECLRTRFEVVIGRLCRGIQCSSCGLRFTSEQTEKYAEHLNWHFRQNRRERDSSKRAMSRKWYFDVQDWIQFAEIEDMEERGPSLFDEQPSDDPNETLDFVQSIPVAGNADNVCFVCGESFEEFWDQEKQDWYFKNATSIENKIYHPICYEDIRNISAMEPERDVKESNKSTAANWKSLEEKPLIAVKPLLKVKKEKEEPVIVKKEPMDTTSFSESTKTESLSSDEPEIAQALLEVKQEPLSPPESGNLMVETETPSDEGKESSTLISKDDFIPEKELCLNKEESTDNIDIKSSQLIDVDEKDVQSLVTLKENDDKIECENLVCQVKVEATNEPDQQPEKEQNRESHQQDDAAVNDDDDPDEIKFTAPHIPGFVIFPPVMRGEELSGLCSIM